MSDRSLYAISFNWSAGVDQTSAEADLLERLRATTGVITAVINNHANRPDLTTIDSGLPLAFTHELVVEFASVCERATAMQVIEATLAERNHDMKVVSCSYCPSNEEADDLTGFISAGIEMSVTGIRVAAVQDHTEMDINCYQHTGIPDKEIVTVTANHERTILKFSHYIRLAAQNGAQMVVLPEAAIGGYPRGFSASDVGYRGPDHTAMYADYTAGAVSVDGPEITELCRLAREHSIVISAGVITKKADSATVFCSNVIINSEGSIAGVYDKSNPTGEERCFWGRGSEIPSIKRLEMNGQTYNVGDLICWENRVSDNLALLSELGVEIILSPTADGRPTAPMIAAKNAMDNAPVISPNQIGSIQQVYAADEAIDKLIEKHGLSEKLPADGAYYFCRSSIANADGTFLAAPMISRGMLLTAVNPKRDLALQATGFSQRGEGAHYAASENVRQARETIRHGTSADELAKTALVDMFTNFIRGPHYAEVGLVAFAQSVQSQLDRSASAAARQVGFNAPAANQVEGDQEELKPEARAINGS